MTEYRVKVYNEGGFVYKEWYNLDRQLHREDGPACEWNDGTKHWYQNGKLHRTDGPAVEWNHGTKMWYINGQLHREDGPAIEDINEYKSWWLNNEKLTEQEFNEMIKKINDNSNSCNGKVVEIDGKKYKLTEI